MSFTSIDYDKFRALRVTHVATPEFVKVNGASVS